MFPFRVCGERRHKHQWDTCDDSRTSGSTASSELFVAFYEQQRRKALLMFCSCWQVNFLTWVFFYRKQQLDELVWKSLYRNFIFLICLFVAPVFGSSDCKFTLWSTQLVFSLFTELNLNASLSAANQVSALLLSLMKSAWCELLKQNFIVQVCPSSFTWKELFLWRLIPG